MRPASVTTSTSGSSHNKPREPLRTRSTAMPRFAASAAMDSATCCAPTDRAAASRGTKIFIACLPAIGRGRRALGREGVARALRRDRRPRPIAGRHAMKIFVPRDAAALSVGAQQVAESIAAEAAKRGMAVDLVRNGSRGLLWLEPLVEVVTDAGRIAYGPVTPDQVASLFDAGFMQGRPHALRLGAVEQIPYLKNQERLTFARVGVTDPRSLEDYLAHEGYRGLRAALALDPATVVAQVTESGLRGRGGAAFPAGIKWKTV